MSGAELDWLRKLVHELRNHPLGSPERVNAASMALQSDEFSPENPCHVHWQGNFEAIKIGKLNPPDGHNNSLEIWSKTVDALHSLRQKEHSTHIDEWLVLTYYRLFRSYNECQEQFLLKGLEGDQVKVARRRSVLEKLKQIMNSKLSEFNEWKNNVDSKFRSSNEYHAMRHKDATWQQHEDFTGLYNKEPKQYINLMNNEYRLYLSMVKNEAFDLSQLEGNTLITFFSNDLNFWATALLDRLEAMAPVSFPTDKIKEREEKEKTYLEYWKKERKTKKPRQKFTEYREHVQKFSMLMQLLYELKDNSELNDERSRLRLEEYAELAHLHCIIAALPDERAKWFEHQNNRKVELEKSWTKPSTSKGSRGFLELSAEERYEEIIWEKYDLGSALAGVARWLANRTNGFYIALASNIQQGTLITDKTRRDKQSSTWGEKVVLKHGENYYQFISAENVNDVEQLKSGLEQSNDYFNERDQKTREIDITPTCFDTLQIKFPEINGDLLSDEWYRAWNDKNLKVLVKLFDAIVTFFIRKAKSPSVTSLAESICLPRLEENQESKKRLVKALGLDENAKLPIRLAEWIHGDEWGENFTVMYDAVRSNLYAIDLEDGLKRNDFDENTNTFSVSANGGFHAQRLYSLEIMNHLENPVPKGAFNALSAVGRLLAALVQKSKNKAEIYAEDNISTLKEIMQKYLEQIDENNDITKDEISVVWLSFFDWLLHWVSKKDDDGDAKFEGISFQHHLNALVHLGK